MISFKGQDIISIRDFSQEDLIFILNTTQQVKSKYPNNVSELRELSKELKMKRVACLFFEPSTRTRISSEVALHDLEFYTDGFSTTEGTSVKKGEPLKDTAMMFQSYFNQALFIRHPLEGSAKYVAETLEIPVVNCGDGKNQHPTQTILDLFSIRESQGRLENLVIALVGDLKYGRTTHSLLIGLSKFPGIEVLLVCPEILMMDKSYINYFKLKTGREPKFVPDLIEALSKADIVYMTRIQRERFPEGPEGDYEYKKVSGVYKLTKDLLEKAKPKQNMKILHPLPRNKYNLEITFDVDATKYSYLYQQAQNGLFVRDTIGALVLGLLGNEYEVKGEKEEYDFPRVIELEIKNRKFSREYYRLENGTLIDHLERGKADDVKKALSIDPLKYGNTILPINNLPSTRYGLKDIIGIEGIYLKETELAKIALVSSRATINYIEGGKIKRKFKVSAPAEISGLVACKNPDCITNPKHYEHVPTKFYNLQKDLNDFLVLKCAYCEKEITREEIELL
ncbi:MAG: aspartate carbamoyltransferase [Candidatus Pacearchaeota archaeon]